MRINHGPPGHEKFVGCVAALAFASAYVAAIAGVIWLAWNYAVAEVTSVGHLGWWPSVGVAVALVVLSTLLRGSK